MRYLVLYCLIFSAFMAAGKDVYISESGAGAQSGAACASAHSMAWFNDQSNWSQTPDANKIAWGDTVHLCGTITSQVSFTGAGDGGTAYTLLWESGCVVEAAAFTGNGWYHSAGRTFYTLDGGANGVIRCTNSGSPGTGLTSTNGSSPAISLSSPNHVTIKNLTISNIYVRAMGPYLQGGTAIELTDAGQNGGMRALTISNVVASHATAGVLGTYGTNCTNILITASTFSNVNWGCGFGDSGSSSLLSNFVFSYNRVWAFTNWDGTDVASRAAFHHNGCYVYAESGGTAKYITWVGNHIGPYFNAQLPDSQATSGLFTSGIGVVGPILGYNNLFEESDSPGDSPSNGSFVIWPTTCTVGLYNNTTASRNANARPMIGIIGANGNITAFLTNNISTNKSGIFLSSWTGGDAAGINNNIVAFPPSGQAYSVSTTSASDFKTLAQWQALGYDTHGTNLNPSLTATFGLNANSAAIGYGANLNSIFTTDASNVVRGATWDAGWREFVDTPSPLGNMNAHGTISVGTIIVVGP